MVFAYPAGSVWLIPGVLFCSLNWTKKCFTNVVEDGSNKWSVPQAFWSLSEPNPNSLWKPVPCAKSLPVL